MLHHIETISVCYGGHFESKMTAKIQKSKDPLFGVNLTFFAPWLPWQRSPF
jgi:hypothetical protein